MQCQHCSETTPALLVILEDGITCKKCLEAREKPNNPYHGFAKQTAQGTVVPPKIFPTWDESTVLTSTLEKLTQVATKAGNNILAQDWAMRLSQQEQDFQAVMEGTSKRIATIFAIPSQEMGTVTIDSNLSYAQDTDMKLLEG